ncbi:unnamed protein product, partial [Callosobruchus maculatus]
MWVGELGEYAVIDNMLVPRASLPRTNAGGSEAEPGEGETVEEEILQVEIVADTGFKWDHPKTMMFLDAYQKEVDSFRNPKVKKKIVWAKIAEAMSKKGYIVDSAQLDQKMRNMKCTFQKVLDNKKINKTGRGRINWPYFQRMEEIFATDKTVNLPVVVSGLSSPLSDSSMSSRCNTPEESRRHEPTPSKRNLDKFRERQLEIEEERLQELKRIRMGIEESNKINKEKVLLLKDYLE